MTADAWTRAVRQQLRLGRLLPLGDRRDGAWITERAAEAVLRGVAQHVRGVRLGALRIALTDPADAHEPAVPPPPGALPPGPLRITADFAAVATEPLPTTAAALRTALATAAAERLGLVVVEVDLEVTALLDHMDDVDRVDDVDHPVADIDHVDDLDLMVNVDDGGESRIIAVALAVPGVARLTGALGGLGRAVHLEERQDDGALARLHARVEVAVRADHRALEVAREVRARVGEVLPGRPTVAVLVTRVG
ncbi:nucleopolyhedrovirus P10 family protein [Streptomyces sp. MBT65]|uniref:nucleopolyhedrovirus P10 family protein n=1 Tax=Streptomyces sp. MBT65 TaxID=1488395 RepID=UPI00190A92D0|nr:nucleopolyhedrovirus P10 family protein [Streptomyces sp. MBT65]MBK3578064.1 nucleopolyhedrovirus P10 family protein [Streptomyces sp. MBT65]